MKRIIKFIRVGAEAIGYLTIAILCATAVYSYVNSANYQAQKLGFESAPDQQNALSAGVSDAKIWAQRKADDAVAAAAKARAEAAALEVARQKQAKAEADAAARRQADEAKAASERQVAEQKEAAKKDADCRADLRCWAEKGTVAASVYCKDRIAKLSKYDMKWTDAWYEQKFSRYKWSKTAPRDMGVITYIGDKAQFQNGFGAFQNVIYTCDIIPDDKNHIIFDVSVQAGRLD